MPFQTGDHSKQMDAAPPSATGTITNTGPELQPLRPRKLPALMSRANVWAHAAQVDQMTPPADTRRNSFRRAACEDQNRLVLPLRAAAFPEMYFKRPDPLIRKIGHSEGELLK